MSLQIMAIEGAARKPRACTDTPPVAFAVMFVCFALPFAALQRKVSVTSAIVAHGIVDLVRFVVLGLPF